MYYFEAETLDEHLAACFAEIDELTFSRPTKAPFFYSTSIHLLRNKCHETTINARFPKQVEASYS